MFVALVCWGCARASLRRDFREKVPEFKAVTVEDLVIIVDLGRHKEDVGSAWRGWGRRQGSGRDDCGVPL